MQGRRCSNTFGGKCLIVVCRQWLGAFLFLWQRAIFWGVVYLQNREVVYGSAKFVKNVLQVLDKWGCGVLQWLKKEKI